MQTYFQFSSVLCETHLAKNKYKKYEVFVAILVMNWFRKNLFFLATDESYININLQVKFARKN